MAPHQALYQSCPSSSLHSQEQELPAQKLQRFDVLQASVKCSSKATALRGPEISQFLQVYSPLKNFVLKATCFGWVSLLQFLAASLTHQSTSAALHSHTSLRQHSSSSLSPRQQIKKLFATSPQHPGAHKPEQPRFLHYFALLFSPDDLWDV